MTINVELKSLQFESINLQLLPRLAIRKLKIFMIEFCQSILDCIIEKTTVSIKLF